MDRRRQSAGPRCTATTSAPATGPPTTSGPAVTPASSPSSQTRPRRHREDGGWLVGFVHDDNRNEADLIVLDAAAIDRPADRDRPRSLDASPTGSTAVDPGDLTAPPTQEIPCPTGRDPDPDDVVARLLASFPRKHRGDGHIAALIVEGVGGLEAHVLFALDMGMPAEKFGRIHHLPAAQLAAVIDATPDRGLIRDGWLSEQGRAVKQRVEAVARRPRGEALRKPRAGELDELMAALEPLAALLPPPRTGRRSSDSSVRDLV